MSEENQEFIEYSARLALHEFLLEIVFASDFATHVDPRGDFESMRAQMIDLIQFKSTVSDTPGPLRDGPPELSLAVQEKTIEIANRFFDKTSARLTSILEIKRRENN